MGEGLKRAFAAAKATNEPQKAIRYRLNVWALVPISEGTPDLTSRDVEKQILKFLSKADFDADVEYMDAETIEE